MDILSILNIVIWVIIALVIIRVISFIIKILILRSVVLCANEDSVRVYRDISPWSKDSYKRQMAQHR